EILSACVYKIETSAVGHPLKGPFNDKIKPREQLLVHESGEEFHLVRAILSRICYQIFNELFREIHVAVQIAKRHLRLDHPELAGVTRRVGILGAKGWTERVNVRQRERERLSF